MPKSKETRDTLGAVERRHVIELWHTSRIPLGSHARRYDRLIWTTKEFLKAHPGWKSGRAYKEIDVATRVM